MSNQLQLTCPKCAAKMNVQRPQAERGSASCPTCSHTFIFAVPKAPPTPPAPEPNFGGLPLDALPPQPTYPPARQAPSTPPYQAKQPYPQQASSRPSRMGPAKQRSATPILIAGVAVFAVLGVLGVGGWMLFGGGRELLPEAITENIPDSIAGSVSIFDSANSIVDDADKNDQEIIRLVSEIGGERSIKEIQDDLADLAFDSRSLLFRSIRLTPLSDSAAKALFDGEVDDDSIPAGPLTEEAKETIVEKVQTVSDQDRLVVQSLITQASNHTAFVREYLRHGHRALPEPTTEGERIAAERIKIIRSFTKLMIKPLENAEAEGRREAERLKEKGEEPKPPSEQEIIARFNRFFGPIASDVEKLGERAIDLADERYALEDSDAGNQEQYREIGYYVNRAQSRLMPLAFLPKVDAEKSSFIAAVRVLATGLIDFERAERGVMTTRLVDADQKKKEAAFREAERRNKMAQEERAMDVQVEQERLAQAQRDADMQAATAALETEPNQPDAGQPDTNQLAGDAMVDDVGDPLGADPFGPGRFTPPGFSGPRGPGGRGPGTRGSGSRFPGFRGPTGPGAMGSPFGNDQTNPSGSGRPRGFADRSRFGGHSPFGGQFPAAPNIDPKTGVTITMNNASGIDHRNVMGQFSELQTAIRVSSSNGKMTILLGHTGPLAEVSKLIKFGTVKSTDETNRRIVVEKHAP